MNEIEFFGMQARDFTQQWTHALKQSVDAVCALYASDATVHPTFSTKSVIDAVGLREYFERFVLMSPDVRIVEDSATQINSHVVLHSGIYELDLETEGRRKRVTARFTFLWQEMDGNWKIRHHHSSERPA